MMKTGNKFYRVLPVLFSLLGVITVKVFDFVLVAIPADPSFHFGLMTVNALFGGFLYSNYGMLVGLLDNETVQKVKCTDIMIRRNANVLWGIIYAVMSVACGLYIVIVGEVQGAVWDTLFCWSINGEIVFMIASMVFYMLSLVEMNRLVKALYQSGERLGKHRVDAIKRKIAATKRNPCNSLHEDSDEI